MYTELEVAGVLELHVHVLNTTIDIHTPVSIKEYHIVADTLGKGPVATSDTHHTIIIIVQLHLMVLKLSSSNDGSLLLESLD